MGICEAIERERIVRRMLRGIIDMNPWVNFKLF